MSKFKNFQDVVIPNFLMNGTRMHVGGKVIEDCDHLKHRGKYLVQINTILFLLDENRLEDATEFWQNERKKKETDNV